MNLFAGPMSFVGGIVATASGSYIADFSSPQSPSWFGLALAGIGGVGTVIGALITFLSNRGRQKVDESRVRVDAAAILAADQVKFRQDMFMEIGRLQQWSKQQDEKIANLESSRTTERMAKHNCLNQLMVERERVRELEIMQMNNATFITQLQERLTSHGEATNDKA